MADRDRYQPRNDYYRDEPGARNRSYPLQRELSRDEGPGMDRRLWHGMASDLDEGAGDSPYRGGRSLDPRSSGDAAGRFRGDLPQRGWDRTRREDRGLQGNYGEAGGSFGFDRGPSFGNPYRDTRRDDDRSRDQEFHLGERIRESGRHIVQSAKRAFLGPKNYQRSDERIREDVSDRLGEQDDVDPSDIEVSVSNGEVTLSGTVQSRSEKFWAEHIADSVSGVKDVHNQLRVRREGSADTRASTSANLTGRARA